MGKTGDRIAAWPMNPSGPQLNGKPERAVCVDATTNTLSGFQNRHTRTRIDQMARGGQSCNPGADNKDVGLCLGLCRTRRQTTQQAGSEAELQGVATRGIDVSHKAAPKCHTANRTRWGSTVSIWRQDCATPCAQARGFTLPPRSPVVTDVYAASGTTPIRSTQTRTPARKARRETQTPRRHSGR